MIAAGAEPVRHRTIGRTTLWLYMVPRGDGFNCDWQDCHGKGWLGGWYEGTHAEAESKVTAELERLTT